MMTFARLSLVIPVLALTACAGSAVNMKDPQLVASPDRVSGLLANAADKASDALQTLAAIEQSKAPAAAQLARTDAAPPELRRAVSVAWVGPVDTIAKALSDRASYSFAILGDLPPVPVVVNIDVENKPIIDVLRDIGLQLGGRADVRVDSTRRVIELHYAPVTAGTEG